MKDNQLLQQFSFSSSSSKKLRFVGDATELTGDLNLRLRSPDNSTLKTGDGNQVLQGCVSFYSEEPFIKRFDRSGIGTNATEVTGALKGL